MPHPMTTWTKYICFWLQEFPHNCICFRVQGGDSEETVVEFLNRCHFLLVESGETNGATTNRRCAKFVLNFQITLTFF